MIELDIEERPKEDIFKFCIKDNGCGMDSEFLKNVIDPFTTKRTTRRVGLGIPLLKLAAENTGGGIKITSEPGVGTSIEATFGYSHIDREPLGDISGTIHQLITSYEGTDFVYTHKVGKKEFSLDTRELKRILDGVSFTVPEVLRWLSEYIKEGEDELCASE